LITAIAEFVSQDGPRNTQAYAQQTPRILPRGGGIRILSELRAVSGMTEAAFAKIDGLLSAAQTEGTINVNTAPPAVLRAVLPELSGTAISGLIETRRREPFLTDEDLKAELRRLLGAKAEDPEKPFSFDPFGISSHWFAARLSVTLGQTQLSRRVIFERSGETGKTKVAFRFAEN
jgi:general secretion pathway protein K